MEKKFKVEFTEKNVQDSVSYILVKEFDIIPNILKAQIDADGTGVMLLSLVGEEANIRDGVDRVRKAGFIITEYGNHITRDQDRCFSCGACISICPTKSFYIDPETYEVRLNTDSCIACGACVDACSVRALKLSI